ncbi:MAG: NADH-quinone oxidoreductase subunit NuoE [Deltaproteobacteria bacterium]|nr:NADH-quinone oxidoreductase subunit NuoE [Deltaproteobacteria bacterium]
MNHCNKIDLSAAAKIVAAHGDKPDACIPILQNLQAAYGYLPAEALDYVTTHTTISKSQILGVASFYGQFRFKPAGRHTVRVCHGTACHVNGAAKISAAVEDTLKIKDKQTSADGKFTLETVACLGCCSLAPVMMIDETTYGRLTHAQTKEVLENFEDTPANKPEPSHE